MCGGKADCVRITSTVSVVSTPCLADLDCVRIVFTVSVVSTSDLDCVSIVFTVSVVSTSDLDCVRIAFTVSVVSFRISPAKVMNSAVSRCSASNPSNRQAGSLVSARLEWVKPCNQDKHGEERGGGGEWCADLDPGDVWNEGCGCGSGRGPCCQLQQCLHSNAMKKTI